MQHQIPHTVGGVSFILSHPIGKLELTVRTRCMYELGKTL